MASDKLSQRISDLRRHIEEVRMMGMSDPGKVTDILSDALGEFQLSLMELSTIEESLRKGEQRFREAINHFPNVLVIYDAERRIKYVNSIGLQIIGLSEQEVIGQKDEEIFPPQMINSYLPALKHAVETKMPQMLERTRPVSMGGQTVIVNIIPLLDESGEVRQILGITYDITDRKLMEEAKQNECKQLLSIFDSMDETVYIADPETYEILYVNEAFRKNWGQGLGCKCYKVLQDRDSPCPFCTNDRIFGEHLGETYIWEFQNEVTNAWYRCIDRAIQWSDGRLVRFELAIDISDRKRAEEGLRKARDELEQTVLDRTEDLYTANLALLAEVAERKWSEEMMCLQRDLGVSLSSAGDLNGALNLIIGCMLEG